MTNTTRGAEPGNNTPKRKAAGMLPTSTTATTKNNTQTVALHMRIKQAAFRLAAWLAVIVRGLQ